MTCASTTALETLQLDVKWVIAWRYLNTIEILADTTEYCMVMLSPTHSRVGVT